MLAISRLPVGSHCFPLSDREMQPLPHSLRPADKRRPWLALYCHLSFWAPTDRSRAIAGRFAGAAAASGVAVVLDGAASAGASRPNQPAQHYSRVGRPLDSVGQPALEIRWWSRSRFHRLPSSAVGLAAGLAAAEAEAAGDAGASCAGAASSSGSVAVGGESGAWRWQLAGDRTSIQHDGDEPQSCGAGDDGSTGAHGCRPIGARPRASRPPRPHCVGLQRTQPLDNGGRQRRRSRSQLGARTKATCAGSPRLRPDGAHH